MLKITTIPNGENCIRMRIEGSLREPWLAEVIGECRRVSADQKICFDLSSVTFVDQAGARFLRESLARGATNDGRSGFVAELLRQEARS
jgi:anti-anti-sigma regulatory factor